MTSNPKMLKSLKAINFKEIWLDFYSKNMKPHTIERTRDYLLTVKFLEYYLQFWLH